jgi:branched-chain amino acid aminotransferase
MRTSATAPMLMYMKPPFGISLPPRPGGKTVGAPVRSVGAVPPAIVRPMASEAVSAKATEELASLDGRVVPVHDAVVPATDEGFIRGDGAFEVIRVYDGRPFALAEHLDRLERSAAGLRLEGGSQRQELEREVPELLDARGGSSFDGCLRIVLTRGGRRVLLTEPVPESPPRVRLGYVTYAPTRVLDGIKSLSYGANMLASRLARESGFDEALLVTPHGRVLEAPTSSIFWAEPEGGLLTPPLEDHILASITRDRVMALVEVEERQATPDDLARATEAFLASTTREVQPVARIEERELPADGQRTREAAAALRAHIESSIG